MRSFRRKLAGLRPGGFTLVELAVVSAILAGLAVAVVTYVGSTSQTVNTGMTATVGEVRTGVDTSSLGSYGGGSGASVLLSYGGSQLTFSLASTLQTFSPTVSGLGSPTFSLSGTLPDGVTFDEATGTFTGPSAWNFQAVQISTGVSHTCALLADGTVRCWGNNTSGQLGDGTTTLRSNPVRVLTSGTEEASPVPLTSVTAIAVGVLHTCALLADGTVRCWGNNTVGAIGDGTLVNRLNPVRVLASGVEGGADETAPVPLTGVTSISGGGGIGSPVAGNMSCAVVDGGPNGRAFCWGSNALGRLGDGTTTRRLNPVRVLASGVEGGSGETEPVPLTGVIQISAGAAHACALLHGTTVRCWGYNLFGQLGDGDTTTSARLNPVVVRASGTAPDGPELTGVTQISAGAFHTCAVVNGGPTGTAWCWGSNWYGQLGVGTAGVEGYGIYNVYRNPSQVLASGRPESDPVPLVGVSQIAAGGYPQRQNITSPHPLQATCSVMHDTTARCWGYTSYTAAGAAYTPYSFNPVVVEDAVGAPLTGVAQAEATRTLDFTVCVMLQYGAVLCDSEERFPTQVEGLVGNPGWPATVTVTATDGTPTAESTVTLQKQ
jgi:prepilin-type N-terminal cleavage/methylation domain-containing protein